MEKSGGANNTDASPSSSEDERRTKTVDKEASQTLGSHYTSTVDVNSAGDAPHHRQARYADDDNRDDEQPNRHHRRPNGGAGDQRSSHANAEADDDEEGEGGSSSSWAVLVPQAIVRPPIDDMYEFEDILGEGAFSTVVLGEKRPSGGKWAIKIIDKARLDTEQRRQRALTEINILTQCHHPSIMRIESIHESHLDVCLVLPLMKGGELFDVIARAGQLKESDAARMTGQLLSALDYLHERGICHRDLKPENILCSSPNAEVADVKITDFGLAHIGSECLATPCGTTQYAAPEIGLNEFYNNSVDLWALGCVLYFMLFGRPPFDGDDDDEIRDLVEEGVYEFPSDDRSSEVSGSAKDLVGCLLETDPAKRFTTKQALQHPWIVGASAMCDAAVDSSTLGATTSSSSAPTTHFQQQRVLKSSMNKAIDAQRDGLLALKPASESLLAKRRQGSASNLPAAFSLS